MPKRAHTPGDCSWSDSPGRLIGMLGHYMRRGLDHQLSQCGDATSAHFIILMILSNERNVTAADLAKRLGQDAGAMTRLIDRMEARVFVRRARREDDRRRVCIELTPQGRKLIPDLERAGMNVVNRAMRDFSATEQRQLTGFLKRMIENVR